MKLLQGKVAIITGAARGIGEAIALKFAEQGANIAFTYISNSSTEKALALQEKLTAMGVTAKAYQSNAADFAQCEQFIQSVTTDFGGIDICVNNAGISKDNLLFGSGIRTFRIVCKEYDNINSLRKDSRCSTHPHNIYLEILSETGTIGFILILLFFFIFLKNFIIKSKNNNNLTIAIGALILDVIFPLKPTGAFFSSWYGSILWYLLGYYYFSLKCLDKQK